LPDKKAPFMARTPVLTGDKCPKCGSGLVKFTSKDGKYTGVRCSTNKYDPVSRTSSGCDFVKFDGSTTRSTDPASEAQMNLLKAKDKWREGMTKAEANKVIGELVGK